ncbi:MAG: RNA polymerase factor sigma-32 [Acidobacteriota bacterium]
MPKKRARARKEDSREQVVSPSAVLSAPSETSLVPFDPLHRYLAEIRRFPLLTPAEEHRLAVRWRRDRDRNAAYRMATANLRLVVHIAMDFRRTALSLMDLIQEGNIGLMQAVQRFDPFRQVRFSAYASWWIRAYILKYIIDHWSLVRVATTNARKKLFFNLKREKKRLEEQGIRPTPHLLAERLGTTEEDIIDVQSAIETRDLSLATPLRVDSNSSLLDVLPARVQPPDEQVADEEYREVLRRKFEEFAATLKGKEEGIFRRRLVAEHPATLQEIGSSYGVTREAIRQIEKRVIDKLKKFLARELTDPHFVQVMSPQS